MSDFNFAPFESISDYILQPLSSVVDTTVAGLASAIAAPLNLAGIIFIFLYGYNVMSGRAALSVNSLINNVVKIVVVTTMATNADTFNVYVKDIFFGNLATAVGNAFNSSPADANVFDYILLKTSACYQEVLAAAWLFEKIIVGFIGAFMILAVIIFCIAGFTVQIFAKVALVMIIGLGPLFISLYLFNATRKFTDAWITTLANFTILQILVMMLGTIMCKIIMSVLSASYDSIYYLFPPVVVTAFVGSIIFRMLPGIASALANGGPYFQAAASSGGQIFAMMSGGLKAGENATRSVVSKLSGSALTAAKNGVRGRGRF
ncbi:type IV secretion system protein [Bartonella sp. F02]|uniref:type IV secretion system protein n=1 Tax=Bartonella sp. F02 TaxID=2967262 RepID=UPI0022A99A0D|nr:type IV secretion system protein [Bartonella sp. F02]MCZ2328937.1 type IV secretion system protein [Bartonella sp. F02]